MIGQTDVYLCERDPSYFVRNFCLTLDEWDDSSAINPKPFPDRGYFGEHLRNLEQCYSSPGSIPYAIPKSRQMMISWLICAYLLWRASFRASQLILIQSKKKEDSEALLDRVKRMWRNMPSELQEHVVLTKKLKNMSGDRMSFKNASIIRADAQGGDNVRSYTPSIVFFDEAQLQEELKGAYVAAKACAKLLILVGTPFPSYFGKLVEDTTDV